MAVTMLTVDESETKTETMHYCGCPVTTTVAALVELVVLLLILLPNLIYRHLPEIPQVYLLDRSNWTDF